MWADVLSFGFRHSPRVASLWDENEMPKIARDESVSAPVGILFAIASLSPPQFFKSRNWRVLRREILIHIVIEPAYLSENHGTGNALNFAIGFRRESFLKSSHRIMF